MKMIKYFVKGEKLEAVRGRLLEFGASSLSVVGIKDSVIRIRISERITRALY